MGNKKKTTAIVANTDTIATETTATNATPETNNTNGAPDTNGDSKPENNVGGITRVKPDGDSKPDGKPDSKPDSKPDRNIHDIDRDIISDIELLEGDGVISRGKGASIKEQKCAVIAELLEPSITIRDGKEVKISVTMSDFFKRLNDVNYCIPISKNLLVSAFGEHLGDSLYKDLKHRTERLAYVALKYQTSKFIGGLTKKDLTALKNDTFTALKDILNRLDYKAGEQYKLNAHTADSIAERAYNIAYASKADIKVGYTAKTVSAMTFLNFVLKLVQISDSDLVSAEIQAIENYRKSLE